MKKITAILVMGLLMVSIAPILGETCLTSEQNNNNACQSNTTSSVTKAVAKSFLNNVRNGTMDFHGNKLVHSILTPMGDVKLTSPLLQQNFGKYDFANERGTPGWYSYDVQPLTKTQKQYEPMVPKIYTTNTSDDE
ncbi:MAG: hypothetical protein AMQ22_01070 [Candidatus Methanofastidiosum methylothiophilum]|uniref:Uncharacterized protein n=1 Tax=Candidatus Methanofastidiosum methylothiophilum TaxID=1705564 RepID=A0A150J426_9EURY|nr:MAG: hypothetical protein AMQ22_01070 [Candidatus Methanofastidiosum methylthiophilus]